MSIIKRLSTTLFSRIDQVVGEIENHDALIEATIVEQRKKITSAKVQLARVQGQESRLSQQLEELNTEINRWAERAVQSAKQDEARALQCMQRRKQSADQAVRLEASCQEYANTIAKMQTDIHRADNELNALSQKHALMRARQSSGQALNAGGSGIADLNELETAFDRWECRISQDLILNDAAENFDTLEEDYRAEEDAATLRADLAALLANREENDHD